MTLLILSKGNKTEFRFYRFTKLEIGDVTGYGWLVIDKRFYYRGRFLNYQELKKEYWKLFEIKAMELHKGKSVFNIFKKR